jgi:hypothetical protein
MSVYEQLKNIGKIVVLVFVAGQSIDKLKIYVDDFIMLDREFFSRHVRPDSKIIQVNSLILMNTKTRRAFNFKRSFFM